MTNRAPRHTRPGRALLVAALLSACATPVSVVPPQPSPTDPLQLGGLRGQLVSVATGEPVPGQPPTVILATRISPTDSIHPGAPGPALETRVIRRQIQGCSPAFLVVPVGVSVRFENDDTICHGFFSSSKDNPFELGLLNPGEQRELRFSQPGLIHLYCSLHADKQATILVTPTPHFALVDLSGGFRLAGLAMGQYALEAWREGRRSDRTKVVISTGTTQSIDFAIESPPRRKGS